MLAAWRRVVAKEGYLRHCVRTCWKQHLSRMLSQVFTAWKGVVRAAQDHAVLIVEARALHSLRLLSFGMLQWKRAAFASILVCVVSWVTDVSLRASDLPCTCLFRSPDGCTTRLPCGDSVAY